MPSFRTRAPGNPLRPRIIDLPTVDGTEVKVDKIQRFAFSGENAGWIALKKYGSTRMPVFLLAKGEQVLADDARYLTMQAREIVHHPGGRGYPREVDFAWEHGAEQVRLALRRPQLIEAVSLLMALPPAKRAVARLVANPYYFRFNTILELEIGLDDLRDTVRGPALYEIMMLR